MNTRANCPGCGRTLPDDAPQGHCPDCLFALLEETDQASPLTGDRARFDASVGLMTKRVFGDYELIEEIARGGMGVVYKARQISLGRIVALKMMLGGQFAAKELIQRFRSEAGVAAALRHPNIVAIYDVGVQGGQHYFSMDFIEGQNLSHLVHQRPLSPRQAARYIQLVAEAIHYAHQEGVLHRDLKPSNILIESATDQPRVTDFGLAKRVDANASLTLTGQVLGSPNFMPPEQANSNVGKFGRQGDIYSLGGILYYVLTGRPPHQGETLESTIHQLVNDEPPSLRLLNPAVPLDLETICLKCLEKDPLRRYASAQLLAEELYRYLHDEPIHARPASSFEKAARWCRRKPALAASIFSTLLLVLVLVIGSPIAAYRINQARKIAISERQRAQTEALRAEAGELAARRNAYAADMNLAQVALEENNLARARELLSRHEPRGQSANDLRGWEWRYLRGLWKSDELTTLKSRAENSKWILVVAFSPDGSLLAAASQDGKVTLWSVPDRRKVGELLHAGTVRSIAFSPKESILATLAHDEFLRLWDLSTLSNIWRAPRESIPTTGAIAYSRDGELLATAGQSSAILVSNLVSHSQFSLDTGETRITELAFSPDGRTFASRNNRGHLRLWNLATRTVNFVLPHSGWGESTIAFSPDGRTLASTGVDRVLNLWDTASGKLLKSATNRLGFPTAAAFSPDGKRLAVANSEHTITFRDLQSWKSVGELKGHLAPVSTIAYSPDGSLLATGSDDGEVKLWSPTVPAIRRSGLPLSPRLATAHSLDHRTYLTQPTNSSFEIWDPATMSRVATINREIRGLSAVGISSGGKRMAAGTSNGLVTVWDRDGDALRERVTFDVGKAIRGVIFSADGQKCAVATVSTVLLWDLEKRIELRAFDHADPEKLTFSMDGRFLASASRSGSVALWELTGAQQLRDFPAHSDVVIDLAFFPDGNTLATVSWDRTAKLWDTTTLELVATMQGQLGEPTAISVSPDAKRVAVATSDGAMTLWIPDLEQPMPVATLRSQSPFVRTIGFLPDGHALVSVTLDELIVWRAPSFEAITDSEKLEARK